MSMKAAVWYGGKDIRIEEKPIPEVKNDEVLVMVRTAGICGSDVHAYGGISQRRTPPLVMGHEFSGEVVNVGSDVSLLRKGDRVVVDPLIRCGVCEQCTLGLGNICAEARLIGLHSAGAFAEYVSVPERNSHKLSEEVSFEEASVVEPLAVAVHAVRRSGIKLGDTVTVVGAGTIGLLTLQTTKLTGARETFVTDVIPYKLNLARDLGADATINSKDGDPVQRVLELTDRKGVNVVLEAVGIQETMQQAIDMVRIGGNVTIIGMMARMMTLNMLNTVVKEIAMKGTYGYTSNDFKTALQLISDRKVDINPVLTNIVTLEEIAKGFEMLHSKGEGVVKVVVKP